MIKLNKFRNNARPPSSNLLYEWLPEMLFVSSLLNYFRNILGEISGNPNKVLCQTY